MAGMDKWEDQLIRDLKDATKEIQREWCMAIPASEAAADGGPAPMTEGSTAVVALCARMESFLRHGLQKKYETKHGFWPFVKEFSRKDVVGTVLGLRHVKTDVGRGRAWIRLAFNEASMESYVINIDHHAELREKYYQPYAMVNNQEYVSAVGMLMSGLEMVQFAMSLDVASLDPVRGAGGVVAHTPAAAPVNVTPMTLEQRRRAGSTEEFNRPTRSGSFPVSIGSQDDAKPASPALVSQPSQDMSAEPEQVLVIKKAKKKKKKKSKEKSSDDSSSRAQPVVSSSEHATNIAAVNATGSDLQTAAKTGSSGTSAKGSGDAGRKPKSTAEHQHEVHKHASTDGESTSAAVPVKDNDGQSSSAAETLASKNIADSSHAPSGKHDLTVHKTSAFHQAPERKPGSDQVSDRTSYGRDNFTHDTSAAPTERSQQQHGKKDTDPAVNAPKQADDVRSGQPTVSDALPIAREETARKRSSLIKMTFTPPSPPVPNVDDLGSSVRSDVIPEVGAHLIGKKDNPTTSAHRHGHNQDLEPEADIGSDEKQGNWPATRQEDPSAHVVNDGVVDSGPSIDYDNQIKDAQATTIKPSADVQESQPRDEPSDIQTVVALAGHYADENENDLDLQDSTDPLRLFIQLEVFRTPEEQLHKVTRGVIMDGPQENLVLTVVSSEAVYLLRPSLEEDGDFVLFAEIPLHRIQMFWHLQSAQGLTIYAQAANVRTVSYRIFFGDPVVTYAVYRIIVLAMETAGIVPLPKMHEDCDEAQAVGLDRFVIDYLSGGVPVYSAICYLQMPIDDVRKRHSFEDVKKGSIFWLKGNFIHQQWKAYPLTLKGTVLTLNSTKDEKTVRASFDTSSELFSCTIQPQQENYHCFEVSMAGKDTVLLGALSKDERDAWVRVLTNNMAPILGKPSRLVPVPSPGMAWLRATVILCNNNSAFFAREVAGETHSFIPVEGFNIEHLSSVTIDSPVTCSLEMQEDNDGAVSMRLLFKTPAGCRIFLGRMNRLYKALYEIDLDVTDET